MEAPLKICLASGEVELYGRYWGGSSPPLDLRMLLIVAERSQVGGEELSALLWPGMASRWRVQRLASLRGDLRRRLGIRALEHQDGHWELSELCQIVQQSGKYQVTCLNPPTVSWNEGSVVIEGASGRLLVELYQAGREGLFCWQLATSLGVAENSVSQSVLRLRKLLPDPQLVVASGLSYRISGLLQWPAAQE